MIADQPPGDTKSIEKKAKPFLKWAGGKSQLLPQFDHLYPPALKRGDIKKYIEPFVGSGAVFFEVIQKYKVDAIYLFDINVELIIAYQVIQQAPLPLIEQLADFDSDYKACDKADRKTFYYQIREEYNRQKQDIDYQHFAENWISRAAMLIFLNRTCYNGLFRLNSKGEFNVPHGRYKNPKIVDEENLLQVSRLLQRAEIQAGDFEACAGLVDEDTFVYFDPPYRPISKTSSFTSYSKFNFGDEEQARLARFFARLDQDHRAKLMLSNSDPTHQNPTDTFFERLYKGYTLHPVSANRMINSNGARRGKIPELVITNYKSETNMLNRT